MKTYELIYPLMFAIILATLETIGQSTLRKFYLEKKHKNIFLPLITWLIYGLCILTLYISYSHVSMGIMEVFWNAASSTIIPIAGIILFKAKINTLGWIGIIFTVIGGTMLGYSQLD